MDYISSFDIRLPKEIYYAGEKITGTVLLENTENIKIKGIRVLLRGKVHATLKVVKSGERRTIKDDQYVLDEKMLIWGKDKTDESEVIPILARGLHQFPFAFDLPQSTLPCSLESRHGTIRYYIKGKVSLPLHHTLPQYRTHQALPSQTSDGMASETIKFQLDVVLTTPEQCSQTPPVCPSRSCTDQISRDALQETKCRRSDARQMNNATFVIRGEKTPLVLLCTRLSPTLSILTSCKLAWPFLTSVLCAKKNCYSAAADDSEWDAFYEEQQNMIRSEKSFYKFVVGDFNAKLDKATEEEYMIGKFGPRVRNESGNRLAELLSALRLFYRNSLFNYLLTKRGWSLRAVSVVPSFFSGSDHHLLCAKIRFSHMMEKNICYRQRRRKEVVYNDCVFEDSLSQRDWHIEEDPNVD
ncbi:hypothetical protein RB195_017980 [Necator americanus]|uniref:Arrestin-like N-terminal domain-containing protein n=1 Tax=Necator americanus TaxID=51031 RepID=A0ABR1CB88_NECAM